MLRRYNRVVFTLALLLVVTHLHPMAKVVWDISRRVSTQQRVLSFSMPCAVRLSPVRVRCFSHSTHSSSTLPPIDWKQHAQVYKIPKGTPQEQLRRLIVLAHNKAHKLSDHPNMSGLSWQNQAKRYEYALLRIKFGITD